MPSFAENVSIRGAELEIDGQPFPWFTSGPATVVVQGRNGASEITVTIPVSGVVTSEGTPTRTRPSYKVADLYVDVHTETAAERQAREVFELPDMRKTSAQTD